MGEATQAQTGLPTRPPSMLPGLILLVLGGVVVVLGALMTVTIASMPTDPGMHFVAPGAAVFEASEPRAYFVMYDTVAEIDGVVYETDPAAIGTPEVRVFDNTTGDQVTLGSSYGFRFDMDNAPGERVALASFESAAPGPYRVEVEGVPEGTAIYVGETALGEVVKTVVRGAIALGIGMLMVIAGVGLLMFTAVRRRRFRDAVPGLDLSI